MQLKHFSANYRLTHLKYKIKYNGRCF